MLYQSEEVISSYEQLYNEIHNVIQYSQQYSETKLQSIFRRYKTYFISPLKFLVYTLLSFLNNKK